MMGNPFMNHNLMGQSMFLNNQGSFGGSNSFVSGGNGLFLVPQGLGGMSQPGSFGQSGTASG